jgi:type IX secretion system PorP/SprF family membrane protein
MAMKRRLVYILMMAALQQISIAQQLPIYSQYLFNKYLINPAVAGSDGYTSLNLTGREQWVGIEGAPQTFSLSLQTRVLKKGHSIKIKGNNRKIYRPPTDGKVGFGGSVFSNSSGLTRRTGFQASYSYHIWLQRTTQLSFGLSFTGYNFRLDGKAITMADQNDPLLNSDLRHGVFVTDASFGVYLLNRAYNLGFSADQLAGANLKFGNETYSQYNMARHYYLFGSYSFEQSSLFELRPSFLIKMSEQLKPQVDVGLNYFYRQSFWTGLAYRTGGALIANVGIRHEKLYLGYAIDFTLQEIQKISYGTHEITLAIKYGDSARKYRWLDRY